MAKGKNLNPADALRKAQRKKELKKNKEQRQKTRDFALVKKDTAELEDEITELEKLTSPSKAEKGRLEEAKSELSKIMKKKEDYVEAHPEARNLVYKRRRERDEGGEEGAGEKKPQGKTKRNLFGKNGLPRHSERSIYYDPVMNPYGMPPPGMPYAERALLPGEVDSEAEEGDKDASDSDDDIPMPEGPPPNEASDGSESDDIPLPEGPPPGEEAAAETSMQLPLPPGQPPLPPGQPPLPSGPPPSMPVGMPPFAPSFPPQIAPGPGVSFHPPPPLPAATYFHQIPPQAFPPPPPPPAGFAYPAANLPPPPPGFFPRRSQAQGAMQDPLTGIPHHTYQAHRAARHSAGSLPVPTSSGQTTANALPVNPNLPPKPVGVDEAATASVLPVPAKAGESVNAIVSAEPELRDFKKESTAFVPAALRKRKKATGGGVVNAAPSVPFTANAEAVSGADIDDHSASASGGSRPDLLGSLREKLGPMASAKTEEGIEGGEHTKKRKIETEKKKSKDDYDKFLDEMGDILKVPQQ